MTRDQCIDRVARKIDPIAFAEDTFSEYRKARRKRATQQATAAYDAMADHIRAREEADASRISELEAANDAAERDAGLGDGNLWRFWNRKAQEVVANRSARISELEAENARLREALREIRSHCDNSGLPNEMVADRVIDRIDETAISALGDSEGQS